MKEVILKMMTPVEAHRRRFRPDDALLSFLKALWLCRNALDPVDTGGRPTDAVLRPVVATKTVAERVPRLFDD